MWNVTPDEAVEAQKELRKRVQIEPLAGPPRLVAGCDIAYDKSSALSC